jgi:hypothetical protein
MAWMESVGAKKTKARIQESRLKPSQAEWILIRAHYQCMLNRQPYVALGTLIVRTMAVFQLVFCFACCPILPFFNNRLSTHACGCIPTPPPFPSRAQEHTRASTPKRYHAPLILQ